VSSFSGASSPEARKRTGVEQYRRLLRYAAPYRRGWLLIVIVTLVSSAFGLLAPWPMKVLVDNVLGSQPMPPALASIRDFLPGADTTAGLLGWVVAAGLFIFAVNSVMEVVLTFAWIRVGQRMVYDLAHDLFARLQRLSLLFHSKTPVGDSLGRITADSWGVHKVADTLLFTPGHALIATVGMIVLMARMDVGLTVLAVAVAPFMGASTWLMGAPIRSASLAKREIESRIQSHLQQTLTGIPVVQAFGREEWEHRRFQEFTDTALSTHRRSAFVGSLSSLGSGLVTTIGTGAILLLGAHRVIAGELTVGGILVFIAYSGSLQTQFKAFTDAYKTLQAASANIDRVDEILDAPLEVMDRDGAVALPSVRGHVRLQDVTFGYDPLRPVLKGVSLEARPGETVAIVGETGAGKSTLVSLVPRFFDPESGRVLIDEHDVRDVQVKSLRGQVALVLQEPFLFPLSIADNIAYGRPGASRAEIEAAARAANAHAFITRLPSGYDTVIGERGATLSGGERQRLSIARALLKDAPILILDEPTSALDAETERLLLEALERLMAGRTTLIIAHRLSTIRAADQILVLHDGEILERGNHTELLRLEGRYARLHQIQFGERRQRVGAAG
jgi:ATP-binding cassette subfamily B protein